MNHQSELYFPSCIHFRECSGCNEPLSLKPPPVWEEVLLFFKPKNIPINLYQGSPIQWRHRAKLAVRGTSYQPLIGLFKQASHEIKPIPFCLVHHPRLNEAFERVKEWMIKKSLIPYQESSGHGDLRYVQGVVERKTGKVQLSFVLNTINSQTPKAHYWHSILQQLGQEHPSVWHSLWLNFNHRLTNTIFGLEWTHIWGQKELWETFGETIVCYGPASFGQANLPLFERMLFRIRDLLTPQACVAEFYAGVGVIGLFIASSCQGVVCSEINSHAKIYFDKAREHLPSYVAKKINFLSSPTQNALSLLKESTTAIVDPPRKGLEEAFLHALVMNSNVNQLLYISCGWEAFKRDCQRLESNNWNIQSVDGYLFFPGSNHVELLVNFKR